MALAPAAWASAPFTPEGTAPYSPQDMENAYGFTQLYTRGVNPYDGTGQTIAIIDAYRDATISQDASFFVNFYNQYATGYKMPAINLTVMGQTATTDVSTLAAASLNQSIETSLDVEYAHAIAPNAKILLIEANSLSFGDLDTATSFAAKQQGVSVVSMSFGSDEFVGETSLDGTFQQPAGHNGVAFVAASGDSSNVSYPAASSQVLSVGGTKLLLDSSGNYVSETGWVNGGGGLSTQVSEPNYQRVAQNTGARTVPDVSYNADPDTGVGVIVTNPGGTGFSAYTVGGTSAGAPQWSALIALANQGRAAKGLDTLTTAQALSMLYQTYNTPLYGLLFHDITSGTNANGVSAGPRYDALTGLGSPIAYNVVDYLAGNVVAIPEPATLALLILVPGTLLRRSRRRTA